MTRHLQPGLYPYDRSCSCCPPTNTTAITTANAVEQTNSPVLSLQSTSLIFLVVDMHEQTVIYAPPSYARLIGLPWNAIIGLQLPELRARQTSALMAAASHTNPFRGKANPLKLSSSLNTPYPLPSPSLAASTITHSLGRNWTASSMAALVSNWPIATPHGAYPLTTLLPPDGDVDGVDKKGANLTNGMATDEAGYSAVKQGGCDNPTFAVCWAAIQLTRSISLLSGNDIHRNSPTLPNRMLNRHLNCFENNTSSSNSSAASSPRTSTGSSTSSAASLSPTSGSPAGSWLSTASSSSAAVASVSAPSSLCGFLFNPILLPSHLTHNSSSTSASIADGTINSDAAGYGYSSTPSSRGFLFGSPNSNFTDTSVLRSSTLGAPSCNLASAPRSYHLPNSLLFFDAESEFLSSLEFNQQCLADVSLLELIHPDDLLAVVDALNKVTQTRPVITVLHRLRTGRGQYRWSRMLACLQHRREDRSGAPFQDPTDSKYFSHPNNNAMATKAAEASMLSKVPPHTSHLAVDTDLGGGQFEAMKPECHTSAASSSIWDPVSSAASLATRGMKKLWMLVCCHQFVHHSVHSSYATYPDTSVQKKEPSIPVTNSIEHDWHASKLKQPSPLAHWLEPQQQKPLHPPSTFQQTKRGDLTPLCGSYTVGEALVPNLVQKVPSRQQTHAWPALDNLLCQPNNSIEADDKDTTEEEEEEEEAVHRGDGDHMARYVPPLSSLKLNEMVVADRLHLPIRVLTYEDPPFPSELYLGQKRIADSVNSPPINVNDEHMMQSNWTLQPRKRDHSFFPVDAGCVASSGSGGGVYSDSSTNLSAYSPPALKPQLPNTYPIQSSRFGAFEPPPPSHTSNYATTAFVNVPHQQLSNGEDELAYYLESTGRLLPQAAIYPRRCQTSTTINLSPPQPMRTMDPAELYSFTPLMPLATSKYRARTSAMTSKSASMYSAIGQEPSELEAGGMLDAKRRRILSYSMGADHTTPCGGPMLDYHDSYPPNDDTNKTYNNNRITMTQLVEATTPFHNASTNSIPNNNNNNNRRRRFSPADPVVVAQQFGFNPICL